MGVYEDLLALFPDNETGDISAADMRTAMQLVAEQFQQNAARISALEQTLPTVGVSLSGIWQLNAAAAGVPGGEQVTCDTGQFGTATVLNFANQAAGGTDFSNVIEGAATIYAQQQRNANNWVRYTVTGPGTDHGTYTSVPVDVTSAGGTPGSALWQTAIFVFTSAAS